MEESNDLSFIVTQNIDELHRKAGSKNIIEIHGNIWDLRCESCGMKDRLEKTDGSPVCSVCEEIIRPDVVLFGEAVRRLDEAIRVVKSADNILVIGTSSLVYPAALLPYEGKVSGANLIEINVERTELSKDVDYFIEGKAGETLPKIYNIMKKL